jgi:hypothetical protein
MRRLTIVLMGIAALAAVACEEDPGTPEIEPNYREYVPGEPSSGERGSMIINEINYAGSVTDGGTWDRDDIFIEFWNKHPRPINMSGWRIEVDGDYNRGYRIPDVEEPVYPNGFFVIAKKADGAFGDVADVIMPDIELGEHLVHVELRDFDRKLMEDGGSDRERVFAGGFDTYSVRSMERAQLIFGNRGSQARNWHAYSANTGMNTIREGWRQRTLASPGAANSPDYSGNASGGNFD